VVYDLKFERWRASLDVPLQNSTEESGERRRILKYIRKKNAATCLLSAFYKVPGTEQLSNQLFADFVAFSNLPG
jgi:hypothetical protein